MAIDVGSPAIDRSGYIGSLYTIVLKDNPANATGVINHIEIYMNYGDNKVIEVASFYVVSGNNLSTRDSSGPLTVNPGLNTFNAPGDFTAFDINEGDYIGIQIPGGAYIDYDNTGGAGRWYYYGDAIPCTNTTFLVDADYIFSLYATGTEAGVTEWLAGVSVGIASVAGIVKRLREIAGITAGVGGVSGVIKRLREIAGISAGVALVSGLSKVVKTIKGTISGVATVVGSLTVAILAILLAGIVNGIATVTGIAKVSRKIASTVLGTATVNGIVKASKKIIGIVPGLAIVIASLTLYFQAWKQKQESAMSFQMKEKPSTEFEKKEKPSMTFQKKEKASTSWTKKEKSSSTWSKK